jgi:hypothetical protein
MLTNANEVTMMDKKPKRVRKPGARSRWCPRCRTIKPKLKPRGKPFTSETARALRLAALARQRREAQGHGR